MLLEDLFNQLFLVFLAFLVVIIIVFVAGFSFKSTRQEMFSLLRWILRGLRSLIPYALPVVVGLAVGALSFDFLSFSSVTMRVGLSVALFFVTTYSLFALPLHRIKWWSPPVKFIFVLCSLVIVFDFGIGSIVADDVIRGIVAWVLSVLTAWLFLYERDTLSALTSLLRSKRGRKHPSSLPKTSSPNPESGIESAPVSDGSGDDDPVYGDRCIDGDCEEVVGSVEVTGVPESYFSGKVVSQGYSDGAGVGGDDVASRFRAFVMSLTQGGGVFGFKQVFNEGHGRFFIQCKEDGVPQLRRVLEDADAALRSWFPDFETKINCGGVVGPWRGGCHACGWVANLPAPSRNPMKHVAELFVQRKLTGSVTIMVESSSSRLSSFSRKLQYRRLSAKARKQEQQSPFLDVAERTIISDRASYGAEKELKYLASELKRMDSKLQAKCWINITCESPTYDEAEMDLDLVLRTFVSTYSLEEKHHEMNWGKFPKRKAEVIHKLTCKLVPRGRSTVLLPSDLALYFWLPELDSVTRVKRKGGFLAPTREEVEVGEVSLGRVMRHGRPTDVVVRLIVGDMLRHLLIIGSTGGGKTNTTMNIVMGLHGLGVPFLIIDPVKKEYRSLIHAVPGLRVFTVGDETCAPLRFDILRVSQGVKPQKHIDMVYDAMCASIVMYPPAPYILNMALNETYQKNGWDLERGKRGRDVSLSEVNSRVKEVVRREGYQGEVRSTIIAALSTRFESLSQGGKGAALCSSVSMSPKELISCPTVVEFGEIGASEDKAIVILMMLQSIYEYLQTLGPTSEPRCAIVVEEAGALFSNVEGKGGVEYDSKEGRRKTTEVISRITAEIRALGAIMIFVNQSAVNLPLEITENCSTMIVHQVADDLDAGKVARMLGLNDEQKRALTSLEVGRPVVKTPGVSHPFQVEVTRVTEYGVDPTKFVSDQKLRQYMRATFYKDHPEYLEPRKMTMPPKDSVPSSFFSIFGTEKMAELLIASTEFKKQYTRVIHKSNGAGGVKPLIPFLLGEAVDCGARGESAREMADRIFVKASERYNSKVKTSTFIRLHDTVRSELSKAKLPPEPKA